MITTSINLRTVEGLTEYAEKFLMKEYGLTLDIPITINSRLTSTYGAVVLTECGQPDFIEIAKRVIDYGHEKSILNTFKHELIHYALSKINKPWDDGDEYFENELIKKGVPRDLETTFVGKRYEWVCTSCGEKNQYITKKSKGYASRCCNSEYKVTKEIIADGFNIIQEKEIKSR